MTQPAILDKISKVLAQAERTDNEAEADAFLQRAQEMATRYSIDLAVARRHVAKKEQREQPIMRTVHIGQPKAVGNARFVNLFLAIASANDVKCNIARNSTYVVAFGFPSDVEVVEALFAHVGYQMVQSANGYLRAGEWRDEWAWDDSKGDWRKATAKATRLSFYDAFIPRISTRLHEAKTRAEARAEQARRLGLDVDELDEDDSNIDTERDGSADEVTGTALVLADKRAEINDFYKTTSNAKGRWSGARAAAAPSSARAAGRDAGDKARLVAMPTLPEPNKALA